MSLAGLWECGEVKIYVHILRKKLNIYLPFSAQKDAIPSVFPWFGKIYVHLLRGFTEHICSGFEGKLK
jgi:hypothetical protein